MSTPSSRKPIRWSNVADHAILIAGAIFMLLPVVSGIWQGNGESIWEHA